MESTWSAFYPSDQANFPVAVGAAAMQRKPLLGLYMGRIHTARDTVLQEENIAFLARCENVHLELTCLVVPGKNDSETEMDALARWVAELDPQITLHVSRFFGRYKLVDVAPTPVATVYRLADVARRHLAHVYTGNC